MINRRSFSLGMSAAGIAGAPALAQPAALAIDEGRFVNINGYDQWVVIRGRSLENPVLFWLDGGPGGAGIGLTAPLFNDWLNDFTVVLWDQPGGGATSIKAADNPGPLNIERYVRDAFAVAEHARQRLAVRKMVVMGISWGSQLGLIMARRRPELFSAYVGTSQVVSGPRGGLMGYEMGLKAARERGDKVAIAALEQVGPPPYATVEQFFVRQQYTNAPGLPPSPAEAAANAAMIKLLSTPPAQRPSYVAYTAPPAGYDGPKVFMETQRAMFKECWAWEAKGLGYRFSMPMFFFQGENDLNTPAPLVREYFKQVKAPKKALEIIPGAGHNTLAFHDVLLSHLKTHVLPVVRA